MSEENNNVNAVQAAQQRNVANNANNVRAAAEIASKVDHPYAKAAGTAIKAADKISGGKASEKIGKAMDTYMKTQGLKGKMMQSALNKMSESGTSNRIASAMNAKNGNAVGNSPKMFGMGGAVSQDTMTSVKDKNDSESSDSGTATFSGSFKVVKYGLIGLAVFFPIIICCLIMASSQIFGNTISLGTADSLSGDEVNEKINKKMKESPEDFDQEIKDEDLQAFYYDTYITDNKSKILKNNKLYNVNIVQTANIFTVLKRKYNEATLDRIDEFFPMAAEESEKYDKENHLVYDFYFKMYNLYLAYKNPPYNVRLDLPLLMATLNLQSSDKIVVFTSNMDDRYRTENENDIPKTELDYYYDWTKTDYKISRNNSEHDMELLAQNMVSKQVKEKCKDSSGKLVKEKTLKDNEIGTQTLFCGDGENYETEDLGYLKDDEKYKEFLKEFLEKKYYLEGEHSVTTSNSNPNNDGQENNYGSNNGIYTEGNVACALTIVGDKYYKTVVPATKECNVQRFNTPKGLEPKFYDNILKLIEYAKTQGCDAEIGSAYRSYEDQEYFYNCYVTKSCNNGNLAAKPGRSNHEYGIAADLRYKNKSNDCLQLYRTNASKYGLEFPLWDNPITPENWHIEPIEVITGSP